MSYSISVGTEIVLTVFRPVERKKTPDCRKIVCAPENFIMSLCRPPTEGLTLLKRRQAKGAREGQRTSFVIQPHAHSCASVADEAHERTARRCLLLLSTSLEAVRPSLWFSLTFVFVFFVACTCVTFDGNLVTIWSLICTSTGHYIYEQIGPVFRVYVCTTANFPGVISLQLIRDGTKYTTGRYSTAPFAYWYCGARIILCAFFHRDC